MKTNYDITIAGSGLTGLCCAIAMSKLGYSVALVDTLSYKDLNLFNHDSRTTALSAGTKNFFHKIGVWKKIKKYSCPIKKILVEEPFSSTQSFFESNNEEKTLGHMIENKNLIKSLTELAKENKNITKIEEKIIDTKNNDETIEVFLSKRNKIASNLLIGADGKHSKVRELLEIGSYKKNYNQKAFTFNIKHQKPHSNLAIEKFLEEGPLASLPIIKNLDKKYHSSIVWSGNAPSYYYALKNKQEFFDGFLNKHLYKRLGKIEIVSAIKHWDLYLIKAKEYVDDKVVLVGDSAHSIHPLAGQGFNLTIRGLEKLYEIGEKNYANKKAIGSLKKLSHYNNLHFVDAQAIIFATDKLNSLFSNSNIILKILRSKGLKIFNESTFLKNIFKRYASKGSI